MNDPLFNLGNSKRLISFPFFKTAQNASKLRGDDLLEGIEVMPDDAGYHRRCYNAYTNTKSSKIQKPDQTNTHATSKRRKTESSKLAPNICIICRTKRCNKKGKTGYEVLTTCETDDTASVLQSFSMSCEAVTHEFAGLSISQITAKEFKYHRSCYRDLTRTKSVPTRSQQEIEDDDIRESCFAEITEYVKDYIIGGGNVLKMSTLTTLTEIYHNLQKEKNISVKGDINRLLKDRLKNRFKNQLSFFQKGQGKADLVYSDETPKKIETNSVAKKIEEVASLIREHIKSFEGIFKKWPPESSEVRAENVKLPISLKLLLKLILRSNPCKESDRLRWLIDSIGQDIVFNATSGKAKTVKHIQLGMFLKRKTGSKEIVTCMNRLGHSLFYSELLELETNIAEKESSTKSQDYIPKKVEKENFVAYVYDNCDHNPETLSGVSIHCTNGIMIQRPRNLEENGTCFVIDQTPTEKCLRRSFTPIDTSITPYKKPTKCPSPELISGITLENDLLSEVISKSNDWI